MKTFEELGISENICIALSELGYEFPMPVQEAVIPILLSKKTDAVVLAQTGTGKTAAFGLPILHQIDLANRNSQVLILSPTRELCVQIADDLRDYSKHVAGMKILPVYGGASIENQIKALNGGVHIIVATPGRLIDLLKRKAAFINHVSTLILDEADEMLTMGFAESLETIMEFLPKEERNTLLFSATMPGEIAKIARKYMNSPEEVTIGTKNAGADNVSHVCYTVMQKDKYLTLKRLCDYYPDIYGIVFCRTRKETQEIADKLIADGYNAESLHGDLSQSQRDFVMQKFRNKHVQILTATDVAARGIDVDSLTHIINYNIPDEIDLYTHRSGRTGRAGRKGISIAIINPREKSKIGLIEKKIGKKFEKALVPDGREVCKKQLFALIDKVERVEIDHKEIEPFLEDIYRKLEWLDKEELIQRFVSLQFNQFLNYYKFAPNLNADDVKKTSELVRKSSGKQGKYDDDNFTSLFINIGNRDGLYTSSLMDLISKETGIRRLKFGKIDIYKNHTVFGVSKDAVDKTLSAFTDTYMDDRQIICRLDEGNTDRKIDFDSSSAPTRRSGRYAGNSRAEFSKKRKDFKDRTGKDSRKKKK
ncbi:MAG: DEAD/DEAH box helicase [Candidatus Kapabacteria bacterium]|nr:DEAD/DEAH box helicase [Candidatus Kapabacteria bacterium]